MGITILICKDPGFSKAAVFPHPASHWQIRLRCKHNLCQSRWQQNHGNANPWVNCSFGEKKETIRKVIQDSDQHSYSSCQHLLQSPTPSWNSWNIRVCVPWWVMDWLMVGLWGSWRFHPSWGFEQNRATTGYQSAAVSNQSLPFLAFFHSNIHFVSARSRKRKHQQKETTSINMVLLTSRLLAWELDTLTSIRDLVLTNQHLYIYI